MQLRHIYILRVLGFVLICLRNPPALGSTPSYPSPRTNSFPGTFVPMMELSFSGPFVPWNFRSRQRINPADLSLDYDHINTKLIVYVNLKSKSTRPTLETRCSKMERSRERKFQGTNSQGNECSRERMVPRTKVPSWERMLQ